MDKEIFTANNKDAKDKVNDLVFQFIKKHLKLERKKSQIRKKIPPEILHRGSMPHVVLIPTFDFFPIFSKTMTVFKPKFLGLKVDQYIYMT